MVRREFFSPFHLVPRRRSAAQGLLVDGWRNTSSRLLFIDIKSPPTVALAHASQQSDEKMRCRSISWKLLAHTHKGLLWACMRCANNGSEVFSYGKLCCTEDFSSHSLRFPEHINEIKLSSLLLSLSPHFRPPSRFEVRRRSFNLAS